MTEKSGFTYTYRTCAGYGSTCSLHESIFVHYAPHFGMSLMVSVLWVFIFIC